MAAQLSDQTIMELADKVVWGEWEAWSEVSMLEFARAIEAAVLAAQKP